MLIFGQTFNTLDHFLIPLNLRYGELIWWFYEKKWSKCNENHKSIFEDFSLNQFESTKYLNKIEKKLKREN